MIVLFVIYLAAAFAIRGMVLELIGEKAKHREVTAAAVAVLWPCLGLLVIACALADLVEWCWRAIAGHPDEVQP